MAGRAVLAQVEIELIVLLLQTALVHSLQQRVVVVLTLAAADDLADAGHQAVHSRDGLAVGVELHVERLDLLRIIGDEDRALEDLLGEIALMLGLQVAAPEDLVVELVVVLLEELDGLGGDGDVGFARGDLPGVLDGEAGAVERDRARGARRGL